MEDKELIKKIKKGEVELFGELYEKYAKQIYRYFYLRLGGKKELAEDFTQEVFLNSWRNIKNYEAKEIPFISYLYKIARNILIDYWRSKKAVLDLELFLDSQLVSYTLQSGERLDDLKQIERIKEALIKLEPSYQEIIILKFIEDLSNKEIAIALGKSEGAVRVLQHRAIKQIKKYLEKNGGKNN